MRVSVVIDCVDPAALLPFWQAALRYDVTDEVGTYRVLVPPRGEGSPVVILQQVPEARAGKNRVHLDLHPDDPEAHIALLAGLGACVVGDRVHEFGIWWQVMTDPAGNEFCVIADAVPPPA